MVYPKKPNKPLFDNLTKQCLGMELPFLSEFPGDPETLQASYGLVVDALFGFSFTPPVRPAFAGVLDTLKRVTYPQVKRNTLTQTSKEQYKQIHRQADRETDSQTDM